MLFNCLMKSVQSGRTKYFVENELLPELIRKNHAAELFSFRFSSPWAQTEQEKVNNI